MILKHKLLILLMSAMPAMSPPVMIFLAASSVTDNTTKITRKFHDEEARKFGKAIATTLAMSAAAMIVPVVAIQVMKVRNTDAASV